MIGATQASPSAYTGDFARRPGAEQRHYINELHSDLRGVKEGWYAIDERGTLLLGPFSNRETCLTKISQAMNWAEYK
jgi:hypothetical protein